MNQEKTAVLRSQGGGPDPSERNQLMCSIQTDLRSQLDDVRAEMADLSARRASLLDAEAQRLLDQGFDARVLECRFRTVPSRGVVCESFGFRGDQPYRRLDFFEPVIDVQSRMQMRLGEVSQLVVWHGTFELVAEDRGRVLVVRVPDADDEELAHRLAVGRLRTAARREGMRVRVQDRAVSLIDPMDTVVHAGTVLSCFAVLTGVDLDAPIEERLGRAAA